MAIRFTFCFSMGSFANVSVRTPSLNDTRPYPDRRHRSGSNARSARSSVRWLAFKQHSACYVEPLMGWTADDDPLATIELSFPTLRVTVRYAERQRLPYVVQTTEAQSPGQLSASGRKMKQGFADESLEGLGPGKLRQGRCRCGSSS